MMGLASAKGDERLVPRLAYSDNLLLDRLEFVWNDVFFWDAGFSWYFFLTIMILYRHASGELGVRLVPS